MSDQNREKLTHAKDIDVFYSDTDLGLDEYKPFTYTSLHIPSHNKNRRTIWCRNELDFMKLVDLWNYWGTIGPKTWIYYASSDVWRR